MWKPFCVWKPGRAARRWAFAWIAALLLSALSAAPQAVEPVPYPSDFRGWVHVKSALITSAHPAFQSEGGLHHIYANPKAAEGYKTGQFPDGSVIVYELLETHDEGGVVSEGPRRRVDVMLKDTARYRDTGGWGFERFLGASQTDRAVRDSARTACFACHSHVQEHGFVFSRMR